jgi:hypothetical protein
VVLRACASGAGRRCLDAGRISDRNHHRTTLAIPPDEWFDDLFGARGNIAVASGTMLAAITSIVALFNAISEELSAKLHGTRQSSGKLMTVWQCRAFWHMGFLAGMRLRMGTGNHCRT